MFGLISCMGQLDFVLPINCADIKKPEREVSEAHYVLQYFTITFCKIVNFL